jgi:hypothetical protein
MTWRRLLLLLIIAFAGFSGPGVPSAQAQVFKPTGLTIPSFFFPQGERRAREECKANGPNCRAAVRAQLEHEMAISLTIPWIILAAGVLWALIALRKQEKKKQRQRAAARRHHDPASFRKLDRDENEKQKKTAADDDDDGL